MTDNQNAGSQTTAPPQQPVGNTVKVPEYRELVEQVLTWNYGDFKNHDEMGIIMDLKPKSNRYYDQIGRANRKLIEHGKVLATVKGRGYEVLNPDDYPDMIVNNVNQGRRKIAKALKIADNAPEDKMSPAGLQRHRAVKDRVSAFYVLTEAHSGKIEKARDMKIKLTSGRVKGPADI